ncbi:MAG: hypothetical protein BHV99_04995 [Clostridium sp. 26_21]|nr:MAG: hypothetical protein BHV99_04995 [Clostridium sp. 26_21]
MEEDIEKKYEKEKKKNTKNKVIIVLLIIIIILLLLFFWIGYKMGKIGFGYKQASAEPSQDLSDTILIKENDMKEVTDNKLNIFKNEKFNGKSMIAPKSYGKYQFYVANISKKDVKYSMKFSDDMKKIVNMKYKLKIDNVYIRGNSENYITIDNLDVDEIIVLKDSTNIFTLEWYWEDNDSLDTIVGSEKDTQYYKLNLQLQPVEL